MPLAELGLALAPLRLPLRPEARTRLCRPLAGLGLARYWFRGLPVPVGLVLLPAEAKKVPPPVKRAKREAPSPVAPAVAAIRAGKVRVLAKGHLQLLDNINWPGATNSILFKRFFFDDFFKGILKECKRVEDKSGIGKAYRWVISGQPGIGKSVYGWYLIYRILTEEPDRAIVYISDGLKAAFVIHTDGRVAKP
jgi:hypothetical protein